MSQPAPTLDFARATAVTPASTPGSYHVALNPQWTILGMPNGGYLAAVLVRCGAAATLEAGQDHQHPVAVTTTFLGAPALGMAQVDVEVLRAGRGATQLRAVLHQGAGPLVESSMSFSTLEDGATRRYDTIEPLELPAIEDCIPLPEPPKGVPPTELRKAIDVRMDPATAGWLKRELSARATIQGWARFGDGSAVDAIGLHCMIDSFPPATFAIGSVGWVPTMQLTCYVRSLPAPGPLKIRQRVQVIEGSFADEVCEIFDARDQLVAQGTQLAKVRFADG